MTVKQGFQFLNTFSFCLKHEVMLLVGQGRQVLKPIVVFDTIKMMYYPSFGQEFAMCLLPSMKALTMRGIALATRLRGEGFGVIESYPGAAQDILGIPRKNKGVQVLAKALASYGIKGNLNVSHDELDAITAAIVGKLYLEDEYEALGCLILPKTK